MQSRTATLPALRPDRAISAGYWCYYAAIGCLLPYIALYFRQLGLSGLQIGVIAMLGPVGTALLAPLWAALADRYALHRPILQVALVCSAAVALLLARVASFWPIMALMLALSIVVAPLAALLDGYAVTIAEHSGVSYGRMRVWGSLGYSAATWAVGWWMGATVTSFFLAGYAVLLLLTLLATLALPVLATPALRPAAQRGIRSLLRERAMAVLLLTTYLVGSSVSIVYNYFGIYIAALGGTAELLGLANALGALVEMPVIFLGAWLINRVGGARLALLAIALYVLRFGAYTLLDTPAWVLPLQLTHGLTYGAFLVASVTLAHQFAGPERAATAQGLLTSMSFGFGSITGALIGGALLDTWGVINVFRVATLIMALALVVYGVGLRSARRREA